MAAVGFTSGDPRKLNKSGYSKGDVVAANAAGDLTAIPVGADTEVLTADASDAEGVDWEPGGGGGGGGIPSNTVVAETSYGQAATAGAASAYSRGDHTHGSPSLTGAAPATTLGIGQAAALGAATAPARADHVHPLAAAGAPVASAVGDSQATGAATTFAASDHRHAREAFGSPAASAVGDTQSSGAATTVARSDHRHAREAFGSVAPQTSFGAASSDGAATTVARSDHTHGTPAAPTVPGAATTVAAETSYGVASAVGVATAYAREDHTHGSPSLSSATPAAESIGASGAVGVAATPARADHVHAMPAAGTPGSSAVGDSASAGAAATLARSDHVHGREGFGAVTAQTTFGAASGNGAAATVSRSDHTHGTPPLGTSAGTAAEGNHTHAGMGDVAGPASATDNAVARFDGTTGKLIQSSNLTLSDSGTARFTGQTSASVSHNAGQLFYNSSDECLSFDNAEADVRMDIGQELWVRVRNETGSAIANGAAVYINGTHASGLPTVALARADVDATSIAVGLATHSIENNTVGYVTCDGVVHGLNTSSFAGGDVLYLSPSVAGGLTTTRPSAPNIEYRIGVVVRANASQGTIFVDPGVRRPGLGTANQVLGITGAGGAQEYKSVVGTSNEIDVTHTAGQIQIGTSATLDTTLAGAQQRSTLTTKGDLYAATASATVARRSVGSDGQVLRADSGQATGLAWDTLDAADVGAVANTLADAKGDLIAASGADTWVRLPVGTNGHVLTADSAETAGVKWAAAGGGGGSTLVVRRERYTGGDMTLNLGSGAWNLITGPALVIPAAVGDYIELTLSIMVQSGNAYLDPAVVVSGAAVRYASSDTNTPAVEGWPPLYTSPSSFRTAAGPWGFEAVSGDISGGNVTFRMAMKGTTGTLYGSSNYPFYWLAKNYGAVDFA